MFLPARSADDWRHLVTEVEDRVRAVGHVQVLTAEHRWILRSTSAQTRVRCASCGTETDSASFDRGLALCVQCTLVTPGKSRTLLEITGWDEV